MIRTADSWNISRPSDMGIKDLGYQMQMSVIKTVGDEHSSPSSRTSLCRAGHAVAHHPVLDCWNYFERRLVMPIRVDGEILEADGGRSTENKVEWLGRKGNQKICRS